jgi:hypothetical protein
VCQGDELLSKQKGVANAANKKTGVTMPQRVYNIMCSQVYLQPIACRSLFSDNGTTSLRYRERERAACGSLLPYNSTSFLVEAGIGACLVRSHPTTSLFSCARGRGFRSTYSGEENYLPIQW